MASLTRPSVLGGGRQSGVRGVAGTPLGLVAYVGLAAGYLSGAWADPAHRMVGTAGDPSLFVWSLKWVPWAIFHGHNPLFSAYLNAPHGVNMMWNTSMLLPGIVLAPVTALWGPVVTYNVLCTGALALSGWTTSLALRKVAGLAPWPAWLGGLAFEFSPFLIAQDSFHLQLSFAALVPLLVIAAHEVFVEQRRSARFGGVALGLTAAAQLLTGEELLAISLVAITVAGAVAAALDPTATRRHLRHSVRAAPWAAGAFALVAGGPLLYQFLGPQAIHGPAVPQDLYVADLLGPVVPTRWQLIHPWRALDVAQHFQSVGAEWCAYVGAPLIALAGATVFALRRRRRGVIVAGWTAVILFVFALGPHLHGDGYSTAMPLPWDAFGSVPPLDSLVPVRFMVAVDMIVAGLVAVAADTAWKATPGGRRSAMLAGIAIALVPILPTSHYPSSPVRDPVFFRSAAVERIPAGSFVVIAPYPSPPNVSTMRWQESSGFRFRMAGGYALVPGDGGKPSFTAPRSPIGDVLGELQYGVPLADVHRSVIAAMRREMVTGHASSVIVGPMAHRDAVLSLFSRLLDTGPRSVGGVEVWTGVPALLGG